MVSHSLHLVQLEVSFFSVYFCLFQKEIFMMMAEQGTVLSVAECHEESFYHYVPLAK